MTALRIVNQVSRENQSVTSISLWDDELAANQYAKNLAVTQDIAWEGYNHRVAFAHKDNSGVKVSYCIGRDDFEDISFGMVPTE